MTGKIPVYVLSGFLGSGKTTLLERLLEECTRKKLRATVLMNEVGKTDTDGEILNGKSMLIEKLLDGCICCNKKGEVVGSIEKLLAKKPDIIFIELTGVANPEEVADSLTEPSLIDKVELTQVLTLVDAEHILSYNNLFESDRELVRTTRKQIEVADWLIVNKTDLIPEAKKEKINKLMNKYNPTATVSFVTYSNIDLTLLDEQVKKECTMKTTISRNLAHKPSYTKIKSFTLPIPAKTTVVRIETFLKKCKKNLLRAKGYVPLDDGTYLMQQAMKRVYWEKAVQKDEHYLVLIGLDLNKEEVEREWEKSNEKQRLW